MIANPAERSLRDYQVRGIALARAAYASGKRAVLFVAPTGSGKSRCAAAIVELAIARGGSVLILAPRIEILGQLVRELSAIDIPVRTIQAEHDEGPTDARAVVASIWTISRPRWRDQLPPATLLIIDEAHRSLADESYRTVLTAYPKARLLGLTATPSRSDGRGLAEVFDSIVAPTSVRELTERGYLTRCRLLVPRGASNDNSRALALPVVDAYQQHVADRLAIVFAAGVRHAETLVAEFEAAGVAVGLVTGETNDEERAETVRRFTAGELRVLVNVGCFVEGFDVPACSAAILARKFGHVGPYLQAIGRTLRPAPGKADSVVVDLLGSALEHGPPDLDREYSLEGRGIRRTVKRDEIRQCRQCGSVYASARTCPHCGFAAPPLPTAIPRSDGRGVVDIADVRQSMEYRLITARRPGACRACRRSFMAGARIWWSYGRRPVHKECVP